MLSLLILLFGASLNFGVGIQEIRYNYAGNYKAWISSPPGTNLPVVIYNYDEYWEWAKEDEAIRNGYDIQKFMKKFNDWGFICIVPINRYRKINAIKGAVKYAHNLSQTNPNKIHLVGVSEGAFLSLLTPYNTLKISSITVLGPSMPHSMSEAELIRAKRQLKQLSYPVLYIFTTNDSLWKLTQTQKIHMLIEELQIPVRKREYPEMQTWFWDENNEFMNDIYCFITGKNPPLKTLL